MLNLFISQSRNSIRSLIRENRSLTLIINGRDNLHLGVEINTSALSDSNSAKRHCEREISSPFDNWIKSQIASNHLCILFASDFTLLKVFGIYYQISEVDLVVLELHFELSFTRFIGRFVNNEPMNSAWLAHLEGSNKILGRIKIFRKRVFLTFWYIGHPDLMAGSRIYNSTHKL